MKVPALAWAAIALTVVIWASFLVVTRAAMTERLGIVEVGLIRFGTGAIFFLPLLAKRGIVPPGAGIKEVILIPAFGGIAFICFLAWGLQRAPVADSGVFTPSMLPVYVALLSAIFLGERFTKLRIAGFVLIILGALAVGGWSALVQRGDDVWLGHLSFTAASISWAIYTILFRQSGMKASDGAALLCLWSTIGFGTIAFFTGISFEGISQTTIATQIIFQGVLSGFVASFTYFYAIHNLGPSRTAAFAALVPILAALGGWALLAEPIGWIKAMGIAVVATGVLLASGILSARRQL